MQFSEKIKGFVLRVWPGILVTSVVFLLGWGICSGIRFLMFKDKPVTVVCYGGGAGTAPPKPIVNVATMLSKIGMHKGANRVDIFDDNGIISASLMGTCLVIYGQHLNLSGEKKAEANPEEKKVGK